MTSGSRLNLEAEYKKDVDYQFLNFLVEQYLFNNRSDLKETAEWAMKRLNEWDGEKMIEEEIKSEWKFFMHNTTSKRYFNILPKMELFSFQNEVYALEICWLFFGVIFSLERVEG